MSTDGFLLDAETVARLARMMTLVFGPNGKSIQKNPNSNIFTLYYVKLDQEEDASASAEVLGYTGEIVVFDYDNKIWHQTDIKFDPSSNREKDIKEYVYERNKRTGLSDKIQSCSFKGSYADGQKGVWSFDAGQTDFKIGKIVGQNSGGYTIQGLDSNLANDGDPFQAICLSGRRHLSAGEIVEIIEVEGVKFFEWNDPTLINSGDQSSQPNDNDNGNFDPLYDGGGITTGILRNFDSNDGKYKIRRLVAKGAPDQSPSQSEGTLGLKITKVSSMVDQISVVGGDGEPFVPYQPPTVDPVTGDPVGCQYTIDFNKNNRDLTLEYTDPKGAKILCDTANIPCCDHNGGGDDPDNPDEDPEENDDYDDDDSHDDPDDPDKPYIGPEDECPIPRITITPRGDLCYPLSVNTVVADITWDLKGKTIRDLTAFVNKTTLKGVEYNAGEFIVTGSKKSVQYIGGADPFGEAGSYSFEIESYFDCALSSAEHDITSQIVEIKSCDTNCDDPEEVDDSDTGGDSCDDATSEILVFGERVETAKYPINNVNSATETVSVVVTLDLQHGAARRSNPVGDSGSTVYSYSYHSKFNGTIEFQDTTAGKSYRIPVIPDSLRSSSVARPGELFVKFTGAGSPRRAVIQYKHDQFIWSPDSLGAIEGQTGEGLAGQTVTKSYLNSSIANGSMSVTLNIDPITPQGITGNLIGVCSVSNNCADVIGGYTFSLNAGGDNDFFLMEDNGNLYVKQTTDTFTKSNNADDTYNIQMTATHESVPAKTVTNQDLELVPRKPIAAIGINNDIAPGNAGGPVAGIALADDGGNQLFGNGSNIELVNYESDGALVDKDYFKIREESDGTQTLMKNVDLPEGTYTVGIRATNNTNEFLETDSYQEFDIIIDNSSDEYKHPEIIGIV